MFAIVLEGPTASIFRVALCLEDGDRLWDMTPCRGAPTLKMDAADCSVTYVTTVPDCTVVKPSKKDFLVIFLHHKTDSGQSVRVLSHRPCLFPICSLQCVQGAFQIGPSCELLRPLGNKSSHTADQRPFQLQVLSCRLMMECGGCGMWLAMPRGALELGVFVGGP
jgi:hypothetical protein